MARRCVGICTTLPTDGLHRYSYDSQGRLQSASTGQGSDAPTTKYAHNALGQRVFKTEALYNTSSNALDEDEEDLGLLQSIRQFFTRLWSPKASDAEHLGWWSYLYDENASLLGDYGMGGANSGGQGQYFYLPTAGGPMPIAAEIDGRIYAIHSDHLNTPRRLTQADGQTAWQWAYSAYGDEAPTLGSRRFTNETTNPTTGSTSIAPVRFNLRYPGQTFDEETGLHYNYFRSYDPRTGRYTQGDPIGLDGGWNRFAYVEGNPLSYTDPTGLVKHTGGQWIDCGKGCRIRIDFTFDEKTGVKRRHLHWECKGDEGECGENGEASHGGTWVNAPEKIKECALRNGFNGAAPEPDPEPPRFNNPFSLPPVYDPRYDRPMPQKPRYPMIPILPMPGLIPGVR